MGKDADTMNYHGVDVSFNPEAQSLNPNRSDAETSNRRKATVDLVWHDLKFTVPAPRVKKPKAVKGDNTTESTQSANPKIDLLDEDGTGNSSQDGQKTILHGVSGYVRAGTMLAVMGSSGAGKTTLLNLLAGRINSSKGAKASGEVMVNGKPRDYQTFRKLAAYVLQDDDMFAELTVEEQLTYAALLRLPASMPRRKKLARVARVIQELGLSKVKNTMVGSDIVRGISGGERKRVNIATELVTDPSLIFLDEPTTGLDSFNAFNVMLSLRQLATNGRTIVSTIHQPRSSIFALFDQLCLLSEGRIMYFGPARDAVNYFAGLNFHSPPHFNPADFFLDLLSIDPRSPERETSTKARVALLAHRYDEQAESVQPAITGGVDTELNEMENGGHVHGEDADHPASAPIDLRDSQYQTSWINEFIVLCNRSLKLVSRERAANVARFGQVIFFAIVLGLIWLSKARNLHNEFPNLTSNQINIARPVLGVLFFIVINQAFGGVFSVIFNFPLERSVVTRERAANTYRTSSYYLSKTLTDMPKTLFFNLLFSIISYWMIGFRNDAGAFFIFVCIIFLTTFLAESLSIAVSVFTGDAQTASAIIPVFIILAVLFGGFFIESKELPSWLGWARYLSFVFYGFGALVKNEFPSANFLVGNNDLSLAENIGLLIALLVVLRLMGYIFLEFVRGPKFLKF